ncbi:universal stress protein [Streptomyces sp. NPDC001604]|uniref:universal stress protein n=1 Tax=Streptomyces sp. NPDC001604 TaxID=3364593 RepID=UPI0036A07C4F
MNGPVVVGADGSPSGLAAVEAAAWEADRRGVGLEPAHALTWSEELVPAGVAPWDPDGGGLRDRVNEALADAEGRARRLAPDLAITREVLVGEPATVLGSASRAASLTVVGSGHARGMRGRLHGSVAGRLTARAGCPVLVVCGRQSRTGPVVLAQDEPPGQPRSRRVRQRRPRSAVRTWWSCTGRQPYAPCRGCASSIRTSPCASARSGAALTGPWPRRASARSSSWSAYDDATAVRPPVRPRRAGDPAARTLPRRSGAVREGVISAWAGRPSPAAPGVWRGPRPGRGVAHRAWPAAGRCGS